MTIAKCIRAARELRGLSQTDLAKRCGLQPAAISHFETGRRQPSIGNLIKLSDALDVSADVLLGRRGAMGKKPDDVLDGLLICDRDTVLHLVQYFRKRLKG